MKKYEETISLNPNQTEEKIFNLYDPTLNLNKNEKLTIVLNGILICSIQFLEAHIGTCENLALQVVDPGLKLDEMNDGTICIRAFTIEDMRCLNTISFSFMFKQHMLTLHWFSTNKTNQQLEQGITLKFE